MASTAPAADDVSTRVRLPGLTVAAARAEKEVARTARRDRAVRFMAGWRGGGNRFAGTTCYPLAAIVPQIQLEKLILQTRIKSFCKQFGCEAAPPGCMIRAYEGENL